MHSAQSNTSNNDESNFTGFINKFNSFNHNLPHRTANQAEHSSNINCIDLSYSCNNYFSGINTNDNVSTNTNISPDYQQSMSGVLGNNNINSTDNNHQQPISNDAPNNDHNYQQPMTNNAPSPQSQYIIDQNPNISPLLNSLSITINSPQTTIIIMPVANPDIRNQSQQDK
ncbi:hypothetical protein C1645_838611 [Glomus cerebriforme]|uniref:Uncharacterized protein n=1 Tax=Glomus cerebriforme TaxID=658196 RepID=A0A397S4S1_9GLOM|nr:hypothetical protein C1645_838611 [Glomus cerebriforme]